MLTPSLLFAYWMRGSIAAPSYLTAGTRVLPCADMLIELSAGEREALRSLFAGFPGLHGCLDAALEGTMGRAWADDPSRPRVAMIDLDFSLIAGDPRAPGAEEVVRMFDPPWSLATSSAAWEPLLRRVWGERVRMRTRVAFRPGRWDRARQRSFIAALPDGFALRRIESKDAVRFAELADSLVYNFSSLEDFIERGVGFGIEHEGRFVSGCSSFAISSHSLEFEIQTHPDFRQRGLASATAAAMIEHCIDHDLEPCWDAHNSISAALAVKLGFVEPSPYTAYELRDYSIPCSRAFPGSAAGEAGKPHLLVQRDDRGGEEDDLRADRPEKQ